MTRHSQLTQELSPSIQERAVASGLLQWCAECWERTSRFSTCFLGRNVSDQDTIANGHNDTSILPVTVWCLQPNGPASAISPRWCHFLPFPRGGAISCHFPEVAPLSHDGLDIRLRTLNFIPLSRVAKDLRAPKNISRQIDSSWMWQLEHELVGDGTPRALKLKHNMTMVAANLRRRLRYQRYYSPPLIHHHCTGVMLSLS